MTMGGIPINIMCDIISASFFPKCVVLFVVVYGCKTSAVGSVLNDWWCRCCSDGKVRNCNWSNGLCTLQM